MAALALGLVLGVSIGFGFAKLSGSSPDLTTDPLPERRHDDFITEIESAAFRLVTAQARIVSQTDRKWCWGSQHADGRPYSFSVWASSTIALLDLVSAVQLVPSSCGCGSECALRALLKDALKTGKVPSSTAGADGMEFWHAVTSAAADAFSCGYVEDQWRDIDPLSLPSDIRSAYPSSPLLRKVWGLTRGYLNPTRPAFQKGREKQTRQQDFDVSLYVPFLPPDLVPLARAYLEGGHMRTG